MRIRYGVSILFSIVILSLANAQEVLVPAGFSQEQLIRSRAGEKLPLKSAEIISVPDTLNLPFFDDFSRTGNLPHPEFWIDKYVYINNTYTKDPVSIGVATLDAIYSDGNLNGSSNYPFESDYLTSAPIRLGLPGREDIWLSFFYEPMGLGDVPETRDSLVLEFLAVSDSSVWETVWSSPGSDEDTFRQVFIPVNQERFLKDGFQFRFKNYASMPDDPLVKDFWSNVDHWNLDYVYLDTLRSPNTTAINDVSMITSLGSLLKNYQSLPWRHFPRAYIKELQPTVDINYRNNDTTTRNATRILKITDLAFDFSDSVNGGATNIPAGETHNFRFPYNFPFIFYDADSAVFEVLSYLVTEDLDYKWNDTVVRYQKFYNYYAYDDGSAENGYGLSGEGTAGAAVAYQFESYKEDTLRGVDFYFNRTAEDQSRDYFRLAVWDHDPDTEGPGDLIYSMAGVRPEYQDELNRFYTYALDTSIIVSDFFYVGWIKTTERILNVGWDRWNNNNSKIFYSLGQEWSNSRFEGSLMIRPRLGKGLVWPVSAPEIRESPGVTGLEIAVYPNPAGERFFLDMPDQHGNWSVDLYNIQGRLVFSSPLRNGSFDIANLPEGLYIVRVNQDGVFRAGSKLLIAR